MTPEEDSPAPVTLPDMVAEAWSGLHPIVSDWSATADPHRLRTR